MSEKFLKHHRKIPIAKTQVELSMSLSDAQFKVLTIIINEALIISLNLNCL